MKQVGKLSLVLIALIALSCDRLDKSSSLGAGIINDLDSSAVDYDGEFNTQVISPSAGDWSVLTDELSGLHRYNDFLGRKGFVDGEAVGRIQSEMVIGEFNGERSFGYVSFVPEYGIDTMDSESSTKFDTTVISIARRVDSLLNYGEVANRKDSVTTAMYFRLNSTKNTEDFYSIEISTLPYSEDSTVLDTSLYNVMQSVAVPGDSTKFIFDLPYHFYQKEDLDTALTTHYNGEEVLKVETIITKRVLKWNTGSTFPAVDTELGKSDTTLLDSISTFTSSSAVPFHYFTPYDSALADTLSDKTDLDTIKANDGTEYNYKFLSTRLDSIKNDTGWVVTTLYDTTKIFGSIDSLGDSTVFEDTLLYPLFTYNSIDTTIFRRSDTELEQHLDSIYEIFDTTVRIIENAVYQYGVTKLDTIDLHTPRSAYDQGDSIQVLNSDVSVDSLYKLNTLNLLFKNTTDAVDPMLHLLGNPVLFIVGHKGDDKDTIDILPYQSKMTVFETGSPIPADGSTISGGLEHFVRLKVDIDEFWDLMYSRNYLSIVEANVEIPVLQAAFPEYQDSTMKLRTMISDKAVNNGELLNDSTGTSSSVNFYQDSSSVKVNITDYLVDLYYESTISDRSTAPDVYLYLWIDGSDMGQVTIDDSKDYRLTYIIQNRK